MLEIIERIENLESITEPIETMHGPGCHCPKYNPMTSEILEKITAEAVCIYPGMPIPPNIPIDGNVLSLAEELLKVNEDWEGGE